MANKLTITFNEDIVEGPQLEPSIEIDYRSPTLKRFQTFWTDNQSSADSNDEYIIVPTPTSNVGEATAIAHKNHIDSIYGGDSNFTSTQVLKCCYN